MDEIAGMARGDGVKDGQEKAAQLINDLQDISLSKIGLIVLGTWIAIALARRVLQIEHVVYAQVAHWLARGHVTVDAAGHVQVAGAPKRAFVLNDAGTYVQPGSPS